MATMSSIIFSIIPFFALFMLGDNFGLKKLSSFSTSITKLSNPFTGSRDRILLSSSGRISSMTKVAWSSSRLPGRSFITLQRSLIATASSFVRFAELMTRGIVSSHNFLEFLLASSRCFFCSSIALANSFFVSTAILAEASFATSDDLTSNCVFNFFESYFDITKDKNDNKIDAIAIATLTSIRRLLNAS